MGAIPTQAVRTCPAVQTIYRSVEILLKTGAPEALIQSAIREHLLCMVRKGEADLKTWTERN